MHSVDAQGPTILKGPEMEAGSDPNNFGQIP